jgi:hypothetical protein
MSGIVHLELTDGHRNYYLVANMSIEDAISKGGTRVVLKADSSKNEMNRTRVAHKFRTARLEDDRDHCAVDFACGTD